MSENSFLLYVFQTRLFPHLFLNLFKKMSMEIFVFKLKTRVEERVPLGPRLACLEGVFTSSLHAPVKIDSLILTTIADYRVEYLIIINT